MKLALCIVLFACSSALGYVAADGLRQRCKAIETLQGILDTLGVRLRYYQEPLSQAVRSTAQSIEGAPHDFSPCWHSSSGQDTAQRSLWSVPWQTEHGQ